MQRKSKLTEGKQSGSITLFLALVLTLIFALLFSFLEAARVQGLAMLAPRSLKLSLESMFGLYHASLWEDYHLLFLDGSNKDGRFDPVLLEGSMMKEDALEQGGMSFYQMALDGIEVSRYLLATDEKGAAFRAQACQTAKEQLAAGVIESVKEQAKEGKELADGREEMQEKWNQAKNAETTAETIKAQEKTPEVSDEGEQKGADPKEASQPESKLPENPIQIVTMWKSSPILAMVVENSFPVSSKAVSMEDNVERRKKEIGNLQGTKKEMLEKVWLVQYLDYYFSCQNGAGKGGSREHALDYELEYCIGGASSDQENLERTVKELLLLREAGNFATIMQDSKKQALALELAAAAVGFTGLAPLVQAVQTGILLAWSYMESVLDVRCLLAGGRVPLIKAVSEWKSDISSGSKALEKKQEVHKDSRGLDYREYLKILLLTVKEDRLVYRAMDIIERNMRMLPAEEHFRMDHLIQGIEAEAVYGADTLFLGFVPGAERKDGRYEFRSREQVFY